MEEDLSRSLATSSNKPAQQPLLDIDLNAPPPFQDAAEDDSRSAQNDNDRSIEEDEESVVDEDEDSEDDEFLDVDNMSYEELLALGERIGTHSRGLPLDVISTLPCHQFVMTSGESECDLCVICRYDVEHGDSLLTLPCKHVYHTDCIKSWLQIQKNCPICNAEVMP